MTVTDDSKSKKRLSESSRVILEKYFVINPYPDFPARHSIAAEIKSNELSVKYWFQNRRHKQRKLSKGTILESNLRTSKKQQSPGSQVSSPTYASTSYENDYSNDSARSSFSPPSLKGFYYATSVNSTFNYPHFAPASVCSTSSKNIAPPFKPFRPWERI